MSSSRRRAGADRANDLVDNNAIVWTSQERLNQLYTDREFLGSGAFGTVYRAEHTSTRKRVAIKKLPVQLENELIAAAKEVKMLSVLDHPNILKFYTAFAVHNQRAWQTNIFVVTELMGQGSIAAIWLLHRPSDTQLAYLCKQTLKGLSYLHDRGIIHRDIKESNILVGVDGRVVIGDLGLAVQMTAKNPMATSVAGTTAYMAPEIFRGLPFGSKVDIWALAVMASNLYMRVSAPESEDEIRERLLGNPTLPLLRTGRPLWPNFQDFLEACSHPVPDQRFTAAQALQLEYMTNVDDEAGANDLRVAFQNEQMSTDESSSA